MSIRRCVEIGMGSWFDDSLVRVVGDGTANYFWSNLWLDVYYVLGLNVCLFGVGGGVCLRGGMSR